jgi:hypothetical protein
MLVFELAGAGFVALFLLSMLGSTDNPAHYR